LVESLSRNPERTFSIIFGILLVAVLPCFLLGRFEQPREVGEVLWTFLIFRVVLGAVSFGVVVACAAGVLLGMFLLVKLVKWLWWL